MLIKGLPLRPRRALGRFLTDLVMLAVTFAAVTKLEDLSTFAESLDSWELLPQAMLPWLAFGIPLAELALGLSWFLGLERRWIPRFALVMLLAFTGLYGAHLALGSPPDCACFGRFLQFQDSLDESTTVLMRNGVLISALSLGMFLARRKTSSAGLAAA